MASSLIFKYGENAIDMTAEIAKPKIVSGILPYGEDGNGSPMCISGTVIWHKASVNKYGRILEIVDFGKMTNKVLKKKSDDQTVLTNTEKSTIQTKIGSKAKRWIVTRLGTYPDKVTIKGIDNYYLGKYPSRVHIGDIVTAKSSLHNINTTAHCLAMDIDYFDHQNDQYIIGPYIPNNFYDPKITMR